MSEEIKGSYSATDNEGIRYDLHIRQADDLRGVMEGIFDINKEHYYVQGSYTFDEGKWPPATISLEISPIREREPNILTYPPTAEDSPPSTACGDFTLTSSKDIGNRFAESFKQLTGQGRFKDKKTGTTKTVENMIFKKT
jgi:hypothetical protein